MLSVRLPVIRQLVVKFWGRQKLHADFQLWGRGSCQPLPGLVLVLFGTCGSGDSGQASLSFGPATCSLHDPSASGVQGWSTYCLGPSGDFGRYSTPWGFFKSL